MRKNTKNKKEISDLPADFRNGKYRDRLTDLYVDETLIAGQEARYADAVTKFYELFGKRKVHIYSAPGRSEIGGNHTDHQRGKVLAAAVNLDGIAVVAKRRDGLIRMKSDRYPMMEIDIRHLYPDQKRRSTSRNLMKGVLKKLKEAGYRIGGFDAYATSDVMKGAGLSSSASFEILIGTIISGLYNNRKIPPVFLAQAGKYAENVYFGKPCGLMDQMASSIGGLVYLDFKNENQPVVKSLNLDFSKFKHSLCIVDTKGSHAGLIEEYAAIPAEMKMIAKHLGSEVLGEAEERQFFKELNLLREKYGDRAVLRALHFFAENKRVEEEYQALSEGAFDRFKQLVKQSGDSSFKYLQNVYVPSDLEKQGLSLGLAISESVLGEKGVCRVHGGGFAGTIQAFVPDELVELYKTRMEQVFGEGSCNVLKIRRYGGKRVI